MEIRTASNREMRWIKKTYLESFPKSERKPFTHMKRKAKQGVMEILSILERGRPIGLAILVRHRDLVLLDYFAIHRSFQGQDYGSRALQMLKERYQEQRLILEIELPEENAPNQEARMRRKHFYLKNGMQETGMKVCVFQVPMEVLTDGKPLTKEEYHSIYREAMGPVFARKVILL